MTIIYFVKPLLSGYFIHLASLLTLYTTNSRLACRGFQYQPSFKIKLEEQRLAPTLRRAAGSNHMRVLAARTT